MNRISVCGIACLVLFWVGCADVPREAVELSATLGRDLAEVHRAHRSLAVRYFGRMRSDIRTFIDTVYRPYQVENTVKAFKLDEKIKTAIGPDEALKITELFVRLLSEQVEKYRLELEGKLQHQEFEVLSAIDEAHTRLQRANAIVTGHLASVRKVQEAQEDLLSKLKLDGLGKEMGDKIAGLSDQLAHLVEKARRGEEKADKAIEDVRKLIGGIKAEVPSE